MTEPVQPTPDEVAEKAKRGEKAEEEGQKYDGGEIPREGSPEKKKD